MSYSLAEVFKPNAFPDLTYVSRSSGSVDMTNEDRLRIACRKIGFLTYVTGMPKTGKTSLCQKVILFKDLVSISGAEFNTDEDIWSVIRRSAQMPVKENKASAAEPDSQKQATFDLFQSVKEEVIAYFKQNKKILLIDDFQNASFNRRHMLALQLKDAIGKGLQVVVVSSSSKANELLQLNPDLSGRISMIKLRPWKNEELKTIAKLGFESWVSSAQMN